MSADLDHRVQQLRAASETTRLRILVVLAAGEMSVSDLAAVLGQSQPRVSRHLKLLCDAGLLLRTREQHWIYYRLADAGQAAELARTLLGLLDAADPILARDRDRAAGLRVRPTVAEISVAPEVAARDSDERAELAVVLGTELGGAPLEALLYAGDEPAAVLAELTSRASRTVALSGSRDGLAWARSRLDRDGLARIELRRGDPRSLPFAAGTFDTVIVDRVDDPDLAALREAARVLRPAGRVVVIFDYDRLEEQAAGGNPLIAARERLARAGLSCARLRPLDLDNARLLLAIAAPVAREAAA